MHDTSILSPFAKNTIIENRSNDEPKRFHLLASSTTGCSHPCYVLVATAICHPPLLNIYAFLSPEQLSTSLPSLTGKAGSEDQILCRRIVVTSTTRQRGQFQTRSSLPGRSRSQARFFRCDLQMLACERLGPLQDPCRCEPEIDVGAASDGLRMRTRNCTGGDAGGRS
jgi:hypothetical protein